MIGEFGGFGFGLCRALYGEGTQPATMTELVEGWIAEKSRVPDDSKQNWAGACEWQLIHDAPELGWKFILGVLAAGPDEDVLGSLAAGPLENLLAFHGASVIERVEDEARRSPEFRDLLGGVWQNRTPNEVWQRVLNAAKK